MPVEARRRKNFGIIRENTVLYINDNRNFCRRENILSAFLLKVGVAACKIYRSGGVRAKKSVGGLRSVAAHTSVVQQKKLPL